MPTGWKQCQALKGERPKEKSTNKKEIVIDDELEPKEHKDFIIRHEILHAFLAESGLRRYREDEDIIIWIAWNFEEIQKVFNEILEKAEEE